MAGQRQAGGFDDPSQPPAWFLLRPGPRLRYVLRAELTSYEICKLTSSLFCWIATLSSGFMSAIIVVSALDDDDVGSCQTPWVTAPDPGIL
jgi:hypothetical protein